MANTNFCSTEAQNLLSVLRFLWNVEGDALHLNSCFEIVL